MVSQWQERALYSFLRAEVVGKTSAARLVTRWGTAGGLRLVIRRKIESAVRS